MEVGSHGPPPLARIGSGISGNRCSTHHPRSRQCEERRGSGHGLVARISNSSTGPNANSALGSLFLYRPLSKTDYLTDVGLTLTMLRRRNPLVQIILIALASAPGDRFPPLRPCLARVHRRLRRGHALGTGGVPRLRIGPAPSIDRNDRHACDGFLRRHRTQPVIPCPLDRLDPPDDPGWADPGLRLPLERPCLLRCWGWLGVILERIALAARNPRRS